MATPITARGPDDGLLGEVRKVVLRARDDADPVLGDLREDEAFGVDAGDRVARGVADVKAPRRGTADADVRLPATDLRRRDPRVRLVIGGRQFLRERQHRRGSADDQLLGERRRRNGEDEGDDQAENEGAMRAHS